MTTNDAIPPPGPTPPGARRVLHADLDCFFAAVEELDDPSLRGRPVIVGGDPDRRGVVSTANYAARRFGVHSAMSAALARRRCPQAVFLPPRFDRYRMLSRAGVVPPDLTSLLAWIACIADARPTEEYVAYLKGAGLTVDLVEPHDEALADLVHGIRTKLLGAELMVKLKRIELPTVDFDQAKTMARAAADAVKAHQFGYTVITATR